MRGLHDGDTLVTNEIGITPAHAGLTVLLRYISMWWRDHPRACGAYRLLWPLLLSQKGSPPRMRGLRPVPEGDADISGITPAHAGLTYSLHQFFSILRDHPRACGAYERIFCLRQMCWGSPPRMRGLPLLSDISRVTNGITPAHAGLTSVSFTSIPETRDHPRACGAYIVSVSPRICVMGSPPRMRGLQ